LAFIFSPFPSYLFTEPFYEKENEEMQKMKGRNMDTNSRRTLPLLRTALLLFLLFTIPIYAPFTSKGIQNGIRLCATTIVPSVFPFMILSSMMLGYGVFDRMQFPSSAFERVFRVNKNGLCAYLCGIFCGFPIGAKCAAEARMHALITQEECERLVIFSTNPSPAFLICGVGGLFGSIKKGVLLYLITLLCGALIGIFLGRGRCASKKEKAHLPLHFSLTEAVENAGLNTLYICSYLLLFSALIGILGAPISSPLLLSLLLPLLEIGSASSFLSSASIGAPTALALCAFAASFGGLCVHLQCAHVLKGTGISMKKFFLCKLFQGFLAMTAVLILHFFRWL
jgi:sporulation integral membrane protein YlbJ